MKDVVLNRQTFLRADGQGNKGTSWILELIVGVGVDVFTRVRRKRKKRGGKRKMMKRDD